MTRFLGRMMDNILVPPLKIQGIKTKAVSFIRDSVTWNGKGRWIEPFIGSGVVLFNMLPDRALLGDTNPHFINFYKAIQQGIITDEKMKIFLKDEGELLLRDGQEHYYKVRERFNKKHSPYDFLFLNRACFNGLVRFNSKGQFNTPFCRKPERFRSAYITKICNQIKKVSNVMAGKDWKFICDDWENVLKQARRNDFVYCDPPYAGRFTDYFNSWNDDDAKKLEDKLKVLSCSFLYSMWSENKYRKNERLHKNFSNYKIKPFSHFYHLGSKESLRNKMIEALVIG